jgi:hypothetical protein
VGVGGSRATARTSVPGWLLKGGTSTSWPVARICRVSTPRVVVGSPSGGPGSGGDGTRGGVGPAWHAVGS